jgi:hypothetical protein
MTPQRPLLSRSLAPLALAAALALAGAAGALAGADPAPRAQRSGADATAADANDPTFIGHRAETERFLAWERDIQLTPEQEKVRVTALTPLPAPCCKEFSAATCCCRCNMAKATWGLAKHMIVEGASAEEVRTAVASFHRAINPDGFSGDVCATGGCGRPFAHNGCGGMGELKF